MGIDPGTTAVPAPPVLVVTPEERQKAEEEPLMPSGDSHAPGPAARPPPRPPMQRYSVSDSVRPSLSVIAGSRPSLQRYYSLPMNPLSPARHRFRLHNPEPHHVKETGNVSFLEDARGKFINQYLITRVVGRGAYGMVYLAVDPSGQRYALKECSKRRLAKLNRAALMRLRRQMVSGGRTALDANSLIRREVAVMKKLDHPNLVTLYEVLDDPTSESLVLVLEWCPEGTIMPPEEEYDGKATPLDEEQCRLYFRDIVLGIEYLHARGVCHRDIKADNILLGENDVAKIADFGVSEIFDVSGGDSVQNPVGSPAYMSPELALLNMDRGDSPLNSLNAPVSGRKADIWAMGVLLFYMYHGRLPFEASNLDSLYRRITTTEPEISPHCPPVLQDLFRRLLDKNPVTRITLQEIREHAWITRNNADPLLSTEENVQVGENDTISEEDLLCAIEQIEHRQNLATHLDYFSVSQSLRNMHGWHGATDSEVSSGARTPRRLDSLDSTSSASSSNTSNLSPQTNHIIPAGNNLKMERLSEALEEVLRLRSWQNEVTLQAPNIPFAENHGQT